MSRPAFPEGHVAISGRNRKRSELEVKHTRACAAFERLAEIEFVPAGEVEHLPECDYCAGNAGIRPGTTSALLWELDPDEVVG